LAQITRLRTAQIANGNVINAADIGAELDQLVNESNSQDTRITTIESGTLTITGAKTFSGATIFNGAVTIAPASVNLTGGVSNKLFLGQTTAKASLTTSGLYWSSDASPPGVFFNGSLIKVTLDNGTTSAPVSNTPVNAQTGTTYTVVSGDWGKLVTCTNASAIAVTLPQASSTFPTGWSTTIQNRGVGTLTVTPTTSTIDGSASLSLLTNQGVLIVSDGTNYFTSRGVGGLITKSYDSGNQTVTASGTLTLAHGLGIKPLVCQYFIKCLTAEGGWSIGDEIGLQGQQPTPGSSNQGHSEQRDATNVVIIFSSNGSFTITNKSTKALFQTTTANWAFIVRAYA
jgi:hypothetical protein